MALTAAPIVRQPMSVVGAPGKTDFVKIYIASELNKAEYRTVLRHESAHVWAAHNRRRPKDAKHELWAIACEMEIARSIYDDIDLENINAPRSRLGAGYKPDSIEGMPDDIKLAEDIYDWLIDHPEQCPKHLECCACDHSYKGGEEIDPADISDIVMDIRETLDADEKAKVAQVTSNNVYMSIRNRTPTLAYAIDAALRVRIEREKSYRRPSRRNANESIILSGSISKPRPPLVEIFVDRSGSFSPAKTAVAETKLREILGRYGLTIRADVWFFGGDKLSGKDFSGGGNTPYELIPQHLEKTCPKLAIIITDADPAPSNMRAVDARTTVLCVPVGCNATRLSSALHGLDVA
jgi:hypothetical protein